MNSIARIFPSEVGRLKVVRAKNIKEIIRYMRIKRLYRALTRKQSKITPAAWQEFIEI